MKTKRFTYFGKLSVVLLLLLSSLVWAQAEVKQIDSTMPVTLQVIEHPQLGHYLADGQGRALYLHIDDSLGVAPCVLENCTEIWPPLLREADLLLRIDIEPSLVSSLLREDGSQQLSYAGWPLYRFIEDTKSGDIYGQAVNNRWYVLSPQGERIETDIVQD